jgi:N-acetylmuramoyl-L-alanine amidase
VRNILNIIIHCTATPQTAKVESIKRYWKEKLKWRSPGYHIIIEPNGNAVRLAPDTAVCNGVAGHNATSLHVSYIGGVDASGKPADNRTQAQKATLKRVLQEWKKLYPGAKVKGHNDFTNAKACPSFKVKEADFIEEAPTV